MLKRVNPIFILFCLILFTRNDLLTSMLHCHLLKKKSCNFVFKINIETVLANKVYLKLLGTLSLIICSYFNFLLCVLITVCRIFSATIV